MKKCVMIMNPESGKRRKISTYQGFYDLLRKYGYELEIIYPGILNLIEVLDKIIS